MPTFPLPITTTRDLGVFCQSVADEDFITVDTEFIRERTYWPRLCLIQLGGPHDAVAVDPLADGLDLTPLFNLMRKLDLLKVFHAGRQDLEIFFHLMGELPAPVFDSQIAAMVCGFGDSVAYDTLATRLDNARIDKSMRFTDWALRPLNPRQLDYALADVTHLRPIYEALRDQLEESGRAGWVAEEDAKQNDPSTYEFDPEKAWRRLKVRRPSPEILAVLREVAAVREREAQERDVPRNRVLRDEALVEIAQSKPADAKTLERIRAVSSGFGQSRLGTVMLDAVVRGLAVPPDLRPQPPAARGRDGAPGEVVELLKVLLRLLCEAEGVAQRLVASGDDLERIAAEGAEADVPAMGGWRRDLFGDKALALANGDVALAVGRNGLRLLALDGDALQDATPTARNVRPARQRRKGGGRGSNPPPHESATQPADGD